jgi:putative ABC transport system permease protein
VPVLARGHDRVSSGVLRLAGLVDDLRHDVSHAVRQLRRAPGFTVASVLILGLGIGATATIFGAVDSVVLRPFPWAEPSRVVAVLERWRDLDGNVSAGNYLDWRAASRSFDALSAEQFSPINLSAGSPSERVGGGRVTADFFRVFGVPPSLGRVFRPDEDEIGRSGVAVLSYGLWMRRFAGDRSIINRVIRLNDVPVTVVGIMPRGFDPTASGEELWMPLPFTPAQRAQHDEHSLLVVGRLRAGTPLTRAQAELDGIAQQLQRRYPQADGDRGIRIVQLSDTIIGGQRTRLLTVLGAVSFVLLIACSNVANLLLARGSARSQEFAVRAALGARRARLMRQLLTESVVLAMLAASVGLALTWAGLKLVVAAAPGGVFPRLESAHVDGTVLGFAVAVGALCAVLFGLAPALRAGRQDVQSTLRGGGRSLGPGRDVLRGGLIVAEVALALVLLDGAALLVRSAMNLDHTSVGFDPSGVITARVALPPTTYSDPARTEAAFARIVDALRQAPGVTAGAITSRAPMGRDASDNGLIPEGRPIGPQSAIDSRMNLISPDYLRVMHIPLVTGRTFTEADLAGAPRVMVVSRALAEQAWPGADPIGKRILCCEGSAADPRWKTVVGVVGDVRSAGPEVGVGPEFYLPMAQAPDQAWTWIQRTMTLVARSTSSDPTALMPALREAVQSVDPALPLFDVSSMRQTLRDVTAEHRFNTLLLLLLAVVGVTLAGAGIASVVAFFVSMRTHEIGVRMAMGADAGSIIILLARQSLRPLMIGLVAGLVAAFATTRLLRGSLYGVSPVDPLTSLGVVAALLAVGAIAILLPARRAIAVDPVVVMRR